MDNATHDAEKLLGDLRDHLARHDKPIAFLFGAGTSCAVKVASAQDDAEASSLIPDVVGLTQCCATAAVAMGESYASAWEHILTECERGKPNPNIEDVLSRLRMMLEAIGESDTLAGLPKADLIKLEETVRKEIAKAVNPPTEHVLDALPHRRFAQWLTRVTRQHPIEIFTVNYDILFELALEAERVPVFDGFVGSYQPFFHADSVRRADSAPGINWTRLWKMHGSVTWRKAEVDGRVRVVRGEPSEAGEMILPSFQKYDESRQQPYAAFVDRLARFLEQDDALLVVAGFGFGDEHINTVIFEALENRPRTHVYALQYSEETNNSDLVARSLIGHNIVVIGPNTGIIGGRRAEWGNYLDGTFGARPRDDSAVQQHERSYSPQVVMTIGDFSCFCDFLASMVAI